MYIDGKRVYSGIVWNAERMALGDYDYFIEMDENATNAMVEAGYEADDGWTLSMGARKAIEEKSARMKRERMEATLNKQEKKRSKIRQRMKMEKAEESEAKRLNEFLERRKRRLEEYTAGNPDAQNAAMTIMSAMDGMINELADEMDVSYIDIVKEEKRARARKNWIAIRRDSMMHNLNKLGVSTVLLAIIMGFDSHSSVAKFLKSHKNRNGMDPSVNQHDGHYSFLQKRRSDWKGEGRQYVYRDRRKRK
jgi:hypothetical protein